MSDFQFSLVFGNNHLRVMRTQYQHIVDIPISSLLEFLKKSGYQIEPPRTDPVFEEIKKWIDTLPHSDRTTVKAIYVVMKNGKPYLTITYANLYLFRGYVTSLAQAQDIWECSSL